MHIAAFVFHVGTHYFPPCKKIKQKVPVHDQKLQFFDENQLMGKHVFSANCLI